MQPPSGTVTFLFTDIEGSTNLWEASPDAMRQSLALHDEIVRAGIEANGGYVFKTVGDAFCAAFHTAPEAAAAAVDAQLSLFAQPWGDAPPLRARMALHSGVADVRDGDYFGQPVNRVARLLAAGHGGQTLLSAAAQELVRDSLPAGCGLLDLGEAGLKDLARSERVYQLNHPDLPSEFAPLRRLSGGELLNNLPQQLTSFVGREGELAQVTGLLLSNRLLTLVGAGGAGKTRLAMQAVANLLDGEGDGVWLVELAPVSISDFVPSAVAQALRIKEVAGQTLRQTLTSALSAKSLLIVLDNCEHLLNACSSLATDLLLSCPGVHILATSREPLGVAGEQIYRVPSLSVPRQSKAHAHTADSLSQYDSVRLFLERAKAAQSSFSINDANAPAVAQLCYRLDGIPLAIELAAARVRVMPVEQLNARLDARFRLLVGGSRAGLPRQQTLRALIDWSYDLLSEPEKLLLSRLSVFAGGWTLDAAETVCTGGGIEEWELLDLLTSLTDKSLVVYEEAGEEKHAGYRYRLLETIRQYAAERLDASGDAAAQEVHLRHGEWCAALAREADAHLSAAVEARWLDRLESEHDNIRAALTWHEQSSLPGNGEAMLRLAAALRLFWFVHGHYSEGRAWFSEALRRAGAPEGQQPDEQSPEARALLSLRAKGLNGAGRLAGAQGDYSVATALHQESLQISRSIGSQTDIIHSLLNLGNIAICHDDYSTARELYQESLEIGRSLINQDGVAASLNNLGIIAYVERDFMAARALFQESHDIYQRLGEQQGIANSFMNLGLIALRLGDYPAACDLHRKSLEIAHRITDPNSIAASLEALACSLAHERPAYAVQLWSAAVALRQQIDAPLPPIQQREIDSGLSDARKAIAADAFEAAWSAGQKMTMEQAVEHALSNNE